MRVQLLSDLHLELHPDFMPQAAPNVDVLELADTYARLRQICQSLGIEWLEREMVTIGTVRFVEGFVVEVAA